MILSIVKYIEDHNVFLCDFNCCFILEKGILKKPGPYCSMDKDRWDDRISSSSQNNLINIVGAPPPPSHAGLSNHHSRQELSGHQHNTMSRSDLVHAASLSRQDLTDHHSLSRQDLTGHSSLSRQDISGRATLSGHSTLARGNHAVSAHPGYSTISRTGPTSLSRENLAGGHSTLSRPGPGHVALSLSREELAGHGPIDRQDSRRDMTEVDRTLKSLNGYHEDILEVNLLIFLTKIFFINHILF